MSDDNTPKPSSPFHGYAHCGGCGCHLMRTLPRLDKANGCVAYHSNVIFIRATRTPAVRSVRCRGTINSVIGQLVKGGASISSSHAQVAQITLNSWGSQSGIQERAPISWASPVRSSHSCLLCREAFERGRSQRRIAFSNHSSSGSSSMQCGAKAYRRSVYWISISP